MGQVGRQYEECLDQRDRQDKECHIRKHVDDLESRGGDEEKRDEGEHCGYRADRDGPHHGACARHRGLKCFLPALSFGRDAVADDHRVVHDDAHHEEEGEDRSQIEREATHSEEDEGTQKGQGNAQGDPGGHAKVKEHDKAQQDQYRAHHRVSDDRRYRVDGIARPVAPDADLDVRRRLVARKPASDVLAHGHDRLLPGRVHANQYCGVSIDPGDDVLVHEPVTNLRNLAHGENRAIEPRDHRNVLELLAELPL